MRVCAFENERRKQYWNTVLSLKSKTKSARKDIELEVAEEEKTRVARWIFCMINM